MTPVASGLPRALAAVTLAFLFVAPFAGSAGLRAVTLTVASALLVAIHYRQPDLAGLPRAVLAAFAAWSVLACASIAWSAQPAYTRGELKAEILYGAMALGVFVLAARDVSLWPRWRAALLAGSVAVAVAHLAQDSLPFALTRHGSEGQGGLWSTHLVLIAPLVLTLGWPAPWGAGSSPVLQGAALLLLVGAAWDTGNRAVWVALCAQLLIVFGFAGAAGADRVRLRAFRGMALAGVVLVAFALLASVKDRIAMASPGSTISASLAADVRPQIWSVVWPRFLEAPLLGHGFGREILGADFEKIATPAAPEHPPVRHSHNLFMDVALQLGAIGLLVFLGLLAALGARYASLLRDPRMAPLGAAGLALLAGFVLKNLTDDFLHRHNALVFWAMNGMLLGFARPAR